MGATSSDNGSIIIDDNNAVIIDTHDHRFQNEFLEDPKFQHHQNKRIEQNAIDADRRQENIRKEALRKKQMKEKQDNNEKVQQILNLSQSEFRQYVLDSSKEAQEIVDIIDDKTLELRQIKEAVVRKQLPIGADDELLDISTSFQTDLGVLKNTSYDTDRKIKKLEAEIYECHQLFDDLVILEHDKLVAFIN